MGLGLFFALKTQKNMVKKTSPRCLDKNDSVKNKLIINTAKEIATKSFDFIAFLKLKDTIKSNNSNPTIPVSAKIWTY